MLINKGESSKSVTIEINGHVYYRTAEACARAGISRATLFRWLKAGILEETHRDRRGWRMFTERDLDLIREEAETVKTEYIGKARDNE
jgi:predicted site-specific integrase-resolvase